MDLFKIPGMQSITRTRLLKMISTIQYKGRRVEDWLVLCGPLVRQEQDRDPFILDCPFSRHDRSSCSQTPRRRRNCLYFPNPSRVRVFLARMEFNAPVQHRGRICTFFFLTGR
jgi:hypothetical protein